VRTAPQLPKYNPSEDQLAILAYRELLRPIAKEIIERAGDDVGDGSWNPDAHIELTLSVAECRAVLEAMGMFKPRTPDEKPSKPNAKKAVSP
jgi:hypothetical protein